MDFINEYKRKLRSPDEAVRVIKSGDWVDYAVTVVQPVLLDQALARRMEELTNVKVRGNLLFGPLEIVEKDPEQLHFTYNSWHFSPYERKLADRGQCFFIPMIFRNLSEYYVHFLEVNVAMLAVTPMDAHGYFNLSAGTGVCRSIVEKADVVIVEINERLPRIYGGFDESIHVSEVDMIVEGVHGPLLQLPSKEPTPEDTAIAEFILPHIKNGSCLQLGIGGMPDTVGTLIAKADLKDLGMHTELCSDAYVQLYESGCLTNAKKNIFKNKGMLGIAFGTDKLYEWVNENPGIAACPLGYINAVEVIGQIDNMVSINSCISADLYGQVNAESSGPRHISGTGGQLDFLTGASMSKGGKAFLCMTSTFKNKHGELQSRILPSFKGGEIVTSPRSQAYFLATEYGIVNLVGRTTWERAEMIISLAHPDFREQLIQSAEDQGIWRKSNKRQ